MFSLHMKPLHYYLETRSLSYTGKDFLTYKAVRQELVDRGKSKACDWSSGVLGAHDF